MARYKLDTGNSGHDEILFGDSVAEVTRDVLSYHEIDQLPDGWTIEEISENEINQQVDGNTWMVGKTPITRENLDLGKIIHTEWTPSRDVADQCGVNAADFFDFSGKFLGPDENGLMPTFSEAE